VVGGGWEPTDFLRVGGWVWVQNYYILL